jgi:hypothetical protein
MMHISGNLKKLRYMLKVHVISYMFIHYMIKNKTITFRNGIVEVGVKGGVIE